MLKSLFNNKILQPFYNFIKHKQEIKDSNSVCLGIEKFLQLDGYSCAIQCSYSIINYYNKISYNDELDKFANKDGLDTEDLIKIYSIYGLEIKEIFNSNIKDIKSAIDQKHLILTTINNTEHWIIIYGYSVSNNKITHLFIMDSNPLRISVRWPIEKFYSHWLEFDEKWLGIITQRD